MEEVCEQAEVSAPRRETIGGVEVVCELAQELARVEELFWIDLEEMPAAEALLQIQEGGVGDPRAVALVEAAEGFDRPRALAEDACVEEHLIGRDKTILLNEAVAAVGPDPLEDRAGTLELLIQALEQAARERHRVEVVKADRACARGADPDAT